MKPTLPSQPLQPIRVAANEPGRLCDQINVIVLALALSNRRGVSIKEVWQDARRLVLKHAREDRLSDD